MSDKYKRDSNYLEELLKELSAEGKECVAGGLIVNNEDKIFVQKRSADRNLFPGCWDIAGGHVDAGESIYNALEREIFEETGWKLDGIIDLVYRFDWEYTTKNKFVKIREFDFLVTVEGDLNNPVIEEEKFSEYKWVGLDDIELLKENRPASDYTIYEIVKQSLNLMKEEYEKR